MTFTEPLPMAAMAKLLVLSVKLAVTERSLQGERDAGRMLGRGEEIIADRPWSWPMKLKFMPREERFFELFNDQTKNILRGADLLVRLVADHEQAEDLRRRIEEVEHEGDITTHEIADRLNRTFNTPFDHEDIHELAARLDDILDNIEATADRMFLYEAGPAGPEMVTLAQALLEAAKALESAIEGLHDVNKNARRIMDYCIEIHRLENVGDEQSRLALAKLFRGTDALYALKWKEIYDHVENALDKCEDVATILEGIVVKHT